MQSQDEAGSEPLAWSDDFKMRRKEASALAAALGYPLAPATLAKMAVQGGGPEIAYFGTVPLYEVASFKEWLNSRTTRARSTAELRRNLQVEAAAA
ncbi:hypothetical protein [Candidatus Viadribacter manganicus]|uniref:DNA-binding protein n=1 Tax=Candidatus Viadribacter manganicus TaxID=1759059 RepID=A0A1B1AMI1_9PROT|nr:hypothetical protein [Candidatus Viadribacter manganicus]ANP47766.1 hypothetical protein ATE48_18625 [Candidatus Viadribacter manganicus]